MATIEPSNQTLIKMIEEIKVTLLMTITRIKKKKGFRQIPTIHLSIYTSDK